MITIFTPTYNRASHLPKLYKSLLKQTCMDFEWIIVDDGSTDNTEEIVKEFIGQKAIDIHYVKQQNGGKHRAINSGVKIAKGELFFIVDSDDFLTVNAIEVINKNWDSVENKKFYAGVAGLRIYKNGEDIISNSNFSNLDCTIVERRYKHRIEGDMAEVFQTQILKNYPFPDFEHEKFCAEGLIWSRISSNYKMRFFSEPIYICEYLPGGLTENSVKNRRHSPRYATLFYKELAAIPDLPLKFRYRAYVNYWRFAPFLETSAQEKTKIFNESLLAVVAVPVGYLMKLIDDIKLMKK